MSIFLAGYNPHLTNNPAEACIYVVLIGEALLLDRKHDRQSAIDVKKLHLLPYWGGDGAYDCLSSQF